MNAYEVNFDALVGPTHGYAGLGYGNLASQRSKNLVSNPRAAALEGLAKMKLLFDLGIRQAVLPPHERPDVQTLRRLGFTGRDELVLERAWKEDPVLLAACSSASAMWAANAATVSPSTDTADERLHFTPANLVTQFHRSLEPPTTARVLRAIFPEGPAFAHHEPLPATPQWADEGAANHTRLCPAYGEPGIEIFVYGRDDRTSEGATRRFKPRQARAASEAVARLHGLAADRVLLVQQNPEAIDAGVFHNDVISVGNLNVLLYHEQAFAPSSVELIGDMYRRVCGDELIAIMIPAAEVSLADAVNGYLFNSQLVTMPTGEMVLVAPVESREIDSVRGAIDRIVAEDNPITRVVYTDVRHSMRNGGGPACLRLRVVLNDREMEQVAPHVLFSPALNARLTDWIERYYPPELRPEDLRDPQLLKQSRTTLDALTGILGLGSLYPFQE